MDFMQIANTRQSCRSFDPDRPVEREKLEALMEAARLAPSACNGQPYHFTVCTGEAAGQVAASVRGLGMNKFAAQAPVMIVISEKPYVRTAALGSKLKKIDYRSIDIGIAAAYITAEATVQGLGTCILGWVDRTKLRQLCQLDGDAHLVIAVGYSGPKDTPRKKIRKDLSELVTWLDK